MCYYLYYVIIYSEKLVMCTALQIGEDRVEKYAIFGLFIVIIMLKWLSGKMVTAVL